MHNQIGSKKAKENFMIANALNIREPFIRPTTVVGRLVALLLLSLSAGALSWAQTCVTDSLPTGDPNHPQQFIQVCIPPIGWNGQLVIYLHGFVSPVPPQEPALPTQELAKYGGNATIAALLQSGFALAKTSFRRNGYVVQEGAEDVNQLLTHIKPTMVAAGSLKKTYLIGGSEGGWIATLLTEQSSQNYDGTLCLCAPMGGAPFQVKYLGDFRVVFDYFFPSVFRNQFKAFEVPPLAYLNWNGYADQVVAALGLNPSAGSQLFNVTRVALNPQDVSGSAAEAALSLLGYSIFETPDLIDTAGGIPYDNRLTLYLGSRN